VARSEKLNPPFQPKLSGEKSVSRNWMEIVTLLLVAGVPIAGVGSDRKPLGEIDFFGYKGLDVGAIRSALPFHEGDLFPPATVKSSDGLKRQVSEKIKQLIGSEPTDVSFVCCDSKQEWMVYIGLPGQSYQALAFHPPPGGDSRFPKAAVRLRQEMDKAWMSAVMKGRGTEDDSQGFALTKDPRSRSAELAIREYALRNETLIVQVLASSSDARHRAIAAQMLGYGRQSDAQVDALVQASLDSDDNVRNNALRALEVLAGAKPNLTQRIPPEPFIRLMRSGAWSDHNKASLLLVALTKGRDPSVLKTLRTEALDPLLEMARWRSRGHAEAALSILGRIAGIEEDTLEKLIDTGQTDTIVSKFRP
jgi:hypothetical protein